MKRSTGNLLLTIFALAAWALSACGPSASPSGDAAVKAPHVSADQVVITGVIQAIDGNTWTINGQTITIDPSVVHGGPFNVGDTVKVEATLAPDGSLVVESVETPDAEDGTPEVETPEVETPEVETETPEAPETAEPGEDDDENEVVGVVTAIDATSITVDGTVYSLSDFTEIDGDVQVGDTVKLELVVNADGTVTVRQVEKENEGEGGEDGGSSSSSDDSGSGQEGGDGGSGSGGGSDDGSGHD